MYLSDEFVIKRIQKALLQQRYFSSLQLRDPAAQPHYMVDLS